MNKLFETQVTHLHPNTKLKTNSSVHRFNLKRQSHLLVSESVCALSVCTLINTKRKILPILEDMTNELQWASSCSTRRQV